MQITRAAGTLGNVCKLLFRISRDARHDRLFIEEGFVGACTAV